MTAEISETIRATIMGLCMQIPEIPAQRMFVSAECHAHSNAHKPPTSAECHAHSNAHKPPKTDSGARIKILTEMHCSH